MSTDTQQALGPTTGGTEYIDIGLKIHTGDKSVILLLSPSGSEEPSEEHDKIILFAHGALEVSGDVVALELPRLPHAVARSARQTPWRPRFPSVPML